MRADDLMSYEQAAEMFPGRNARWVRDRLVRRKRVDVVKVGRTRFIKRESLVRFIAASTVRGFSWN